MSKYFSNNTGMDTTSIPTPEKRVIPNPITPDDNVDKNRELLSTPPSNIEEEILQVAAQSAIVNETMDEINKINPRKIEDMEGALKKFQPAELFERLNQITFLMVEMNNRLTSIENVLSEGGTLNDKIPENVEKTLSPREQFERDNPENTKPDLMNVNTVKEQLAAATKQKKIPGIPSENYVDKGVKLEEVFPEQSDEAYQAAYESMAIQESKPSTRTQPNISKSPKGGSTGIVF